MTGCSRLVIGKRGSLSSSSDQCTQRVYQNLQDARIISPLAVIQEFQSPPDDQLAQLVVTQKEMFQVDQLPLTALSAIS